LKLRKLISSLIVVALLALGTYWYEENGSSPPSSPVNSDIIQLDFPADRYPETAKHIQDAIANGESAICTIDREQAEENRRLSLKGIPTKKGYDRDEWPMAMCKEGGTGADIEYISPSDNRGAGSWVGNQLEGYADGVQVQFMFQ
jgi:hypothetical protein